MTDMDLELATRDELIGALTKERQELRSAKDRLVQEQTGTAKLIEELDRLAAELAEIRDSGPCSDHAEELERLSGEAALLKGERMETWDALRKADGWSEDSTTPKLRQVVHKLRCLRELKTAYGEALSLLGAYAKRDLLKIRIRIDKQELAANEKFLEDSGEAIGRLCDLDLPF